ncbi:PucR family transcriptional regulator [Mycolicibacterium goodii]|uniref:PucR family transcriptional regulator n=1 Tax=Mycolicibacterium goodii TaxID=134601 RepID=UPI0013047616|nr:PucR family transcriptional regulator ligand-binding domain-containing protein [Mycolicibacterium goodii]
MLPTVREVLSTALIAAAEPEILAGKEHMDRPVRWLHPAEVADIGPLLRGDEIVLTTGISLSERTDDLRSYVESLAAAGVSGLIVELGRRWTTLPAVLVEGCRTAGVVLIALHREVRFAAVVQEVGARIVDAEVEDLRATEHIHEMFTRLDLEAAEPQAILAAVVRLAGSPVVLESARHQVIDYDAAGRPPAEILTDWVRRSRSVGLPGRIGYDRKSGWLMTVVGSRGDDWGRLILLGRRRPSRRDYVLIERAAGALSLHQMRARARDNAESNTHGSILADLRERRVTTELVMRCEAVGLPIRQRQFTAIAVRLTSDAGHQRRWSLADLASALRSISRSLDVPMLIGLDTDHVIALLSMAADTAPNAVTLGVVEQLRATVKVSVARGEVVDRLEHTFRTLIDARIVLAASDDDGARPWVTTADVHVRGLVHLLRDDERLKLFTHRELGPLLSYDAEHGTSLFHVLDVYLQTPGGKAAVAKALLLSRPVLYERLDKIERVLSVNLEDPHIRTSLHIALIAHTVLNSADSAGSLPDP